MKQEQILFKKSAAGFDNVLVVPQSSKRKCELKNVKKLTGKFEAERVAL